LIFPLSFYFTASAKASSDINRMEVSGLVLGLFNHLHRHDVTIAKQPSQMGQNVSKTGCPQYNNILFNFDGDRLDRRPHMESGKCCRPVYGCLSRPSWKQNSFQAIDTSCSTENCINPSTSNFGSSNITFTNLPVSQKEWASPALSNPCLNCTSENYDAISCH
jgi:hypothetical protein